MSRPRHDTFCKSISVSLECWPWHYEVTLVVWYLAVYQQWIGFTLGGRTLVKKHLNWLEELDWDIARGHNAKHWEEHESVIPLRPRQEHQMGFRAGHQILRRGCGMMLVLRSLGIQYRWPERSLPEEVKEVASYKRRALRPWLSPSIHAQRVIRRRRFWRWVSCDSRSNRESYHEGRRPAVRLSKEFHSPALGPDPCFIVMHDTRPHMAARSGAVRERRRE